MRLVSESSRSASHGQSWLFTHAMWLYPFSRTSSSLMSTAKGNLIKDLLSVTSPSLPNLNVKFPVLGDFWICAGSASWTASKKLSHYIGWDSGNSIIIIKT